jgi:hypothetical protein
MCVPDVSRGEARVPDVFPLDKIFPLFDQLLVGPPSLPLYVGLALLRQLRAPLLAAGFNDATLIFSDSPDVDMSLCVQQVRVRAHTSTCTAGGD